MSVVRANTYQDASGGSNAVFSGVANPPGSMGFRNRLINSDMRIAQRGTSAVTTDGSFPVDRYKTSISGSATMSFQQSSTVPSGAGFINSVQCTVTSGAAQGSSTFYRLFQVIEGSNTADWSLGSASAQNMTLSFWVRSSVTGTYSGHLLESNSGTASYIFNYTISAANTWEQKTVNIAGPTIGTWQTGANGSILVGFDLGSGTSTESTAGSWLAASNKMRTAGSVVLSATTSATWFVTGVQLEAGTNASAFEQIDYGRELMMCQRYFYRVASGLGVSGIGETIGVATYFSASQLSTMLTFPVAMRASPTIYQVTGTDYFKLERNGGTDYFNSFTIYYQSTQAAMAYNNSEASGTAGQSGTIATNNASAYFGFAAEL
jgi:hypothetical protein